MGWGKGLLVGGEFMAVVTLGSGLGVTSCHHIWVRDETCAGGLSSSPWDSVRILPPTKGPGTPGSSLLADAPEMPWDQDSGWWGVEAAGGMLLGAGPGETQWCPILILCTGAEPQPGFRGGPRCSMVHPTECEVDGWDFGDVS